MLCFFASNVGLKQSPCLIFTLFFHTSLGIWKTRSKQSITFATTETHEMKLSPHYARKLVQHSTELKLNILQTPTG